MTTFFTSDTHFGDQRVLRIDRRPFTTIQEHPTLMPFQKVRAMHSLLNALEGRVPTKSELTLLENVFGKETANGVYVVTAFVAGAS